MNLYNWQYTQASQKVPWWLCNVLYGSDVQFLLQGNCNDVHSASIQKTLKNPWIETRVPVSRAGV